jgi:phospholipid transport system substrate-binding protein
MRAALLWFFALAFTFAAPASAQNTNVAERFVSTNIRAGLAILNDSSLDSAARAARFEEFLLGITDLKRVATFTLGSVPASPDQREAFAAAFQGYAVAVYRSYFQNYGGQTLIVTGSSANGPGDTIVHTRLAGANGANSLAIDFRIRTDGPKPLVLDIGISGVWLALAQRDDFATFLARNGGDVSALIQHLDSIAQSSH